MKTLSFSSITGVFFVLCALSERNVQPQSNRVRLKSTYTVILMGCPIRPP